MNKSMWFVGVVNEASSFLTEVEKSLTHPSFKIDFQKHCFLDRQAPFEISYPVGVKRDWSHILSMGLFGKYYVDPDKVNPLPRSLVNGMIEQSIVPAVCPGDEPATISINHSKSDDAWIMFKYLQEEIPKRCKKYGYDCRFEHDFGFGYTLKIRNKPSDL
jgi:hypothetical protein